MIVLPSAAATIAAHAESAGPVETGGLLLGWRRRDLDVIVVTEATGPGRNARRSRFGLVLDVQDLQAVVDQAWERSEETVTYLGDWHLHHEAEPRPSPIDRRSVREVSEDARIGVSQPLLMIIGEPPDGHWRAWVGPQLAPASPVLVESPR